MILDGNQSEKTGPSLEWFRSGSPRLGRSLEFRLFLAIWIIYMVHVVPGGGVNPSRYFDLTHSLVEEHTVSIDAYHENTNDKAFKDGHYYAAGLPGPSVAGIPAYLAFKALYRILPARVWKPFSNLQYGFYQKEGISFFVSNIWITCFSLSLLSALAAVVFFRVFLLLGIKRVDALVATVAYALGTPVFFFSTTFFSHVFGASLAIFALYLLVRTASSPRLWTFVWLGLVTGCAALMEYQGMFLAIGVGIYILWNWRHKPLLSYCLGGLVPLALLVTYNIAAFGGPFHSSYEFLASSDREHLTVGLLGFTAPTLGRLAKLSFLPERGMFLYSPVLLLAFVGWFTALRRRKQPALRVTLLSLLISLTLWVWIGSFIDWHGATSFGPRYLVFAIPFMFVGVAQSLSKVPKFVSAPLILLSLATNWLGAQYGFADNVWEPWRTFKTEGFTLPVFSAIARHSQVGDSLTVLIANWSWLITVLYSALIFSFFLLLVDSFRRRQADVASQLQEFAEASRQDEGLRLPFVSVLMPVRNENAFIRRSLGAVLAQNYPAGRMEVIVADGMSTDGTRELIAEISRGHKNVTLLDNPGKIVATGLNAGVRMASGEVVIRVDGHCEVAPDYVRRCVSHVVNNEADCVGGPLETIGETLRARAVAAAMSSRFGVGGSTFRIGSSAAKYVDTVAFPAYKRETLDRVGGFDEELVRNQDDEYNYRLSKLGGRILLSPDIRARYYSRATFFSLCKQYFQYGYWKIGRAHV